MISLRTLSCLGLRGEVPCHAVLCCDVMRYAMLCCAALARLGLLQCGAFNVADSYYVAVYATANCSLVNTVQKLDMLSPSMHTCESFDCSVIVSRCAMLHMDVHVAVLLLQVLNSISKPPGSAPPFIPFKPVPRLVPLPSKHTLPVQQPNRFKLSNFGHLREENLQMVLLARRITQQLVDIRQAHVTLCFSSIQTPCKLFLHCIQASSLQPVCCADHEAQLRSKLCYLCLTFINVLQSTGTSFSCCQCPRHVYPYPYAY